MSDQSMTALERAKTVKAHRARLWREVRDSATISEACGLLAVILEDDRNLSALASLRVEALLRWKPLSALSPQFRRRLLDEAWCSEYVRVGELSARQVDALAEALRSRPDTLRAREQRRKAAA